jgi:hypothetical protein
VGNAESIKLSASNVESMMLLAHAESMDTLSAGDESIILSATPAESMILSALFGHFITLQRASQKKGYHRKSYSYVGSTQEKPTFPNQNSLGMEQSSLHHAVTTSHPMINESHDGLPRERHYKFFSRKPMHLKSPVVFNHPTLLIKPIRCTGFHRLQPANCYISTYPS